MIKFFTYIFLFLCCTLTTAQIVTIPDSNFKSTLVNSNCVDVNNDGVGDIDADTNDDGEIQVSEAQAVNSLVLRNSGISSLVGIESFVNLEDLICENNFLESLDLSQNTSLVSLDCSRNDLISLDLSENVSLEKLFCQQNQLTSLNVSQNTALEFLLCSTNPLVTLDVSQNENLINLDISQTSLTDILLDNLAALRFLQFSQTPIENIDVSNNINLRGMSCDQTSLSTIDLSQNILLETFQSTDNQFSNFDVSANTNLRSLFLYNNNLTTLNLSQNAALESLHVSDNELVSLDLSNNSSLTYLYAINNNLEYLNMQNGNNLNVFQCVTSNNPNLFCMQVDDVSTPSKQNGWFQDEWTDYSLECLLGIEDMEEMLPFYTYPNPVEDILFVGNKSELAVQSLMLIDTFGRKVQDINYDPNGWSVGMLTSGVYILRIVADNKIYTHKFVIK